MNGPPLYAIQVCKLGQGAECCRYLGAGPNGLECLKVQPPFRMAIDAKHAQGTMTARGDNCDGLESLP